MSRIDTFAAWLLFSVLLTAALGFMLFAADLLSTRGLVVFLSLVIAEIAVASLIYSQARGDRFDIFEPSIVANLMFLLYYCVRPIYLMYNLDVANGIFASMNPADPFDYAWAVGYAALGLVCFQAGYFAMKLDYCETSRPQSYLRDWDTGRSNLVVIIGGLWAMASCAMAVSAAGGIAGILANAGRLREVTAGYGYAILGGGFFPIGAVLLLVDQLLGHPRKFWIILFCAMSVVFPALFGNRTGIFAVLISCIVVYAHIRRIRRPWRIAALFMILVLVVVPLVVFLGFARESNVGASEIPRVASTMIDNGSSFFYSQTLGEFSAVDSFAAIIHGGPSVFPFRYGETYLDAVLFIIPRSVWPAKPQAFSTAVGDYVTRNGNDVPPGIIGELYVNFHLFGIVTGMFLLGRLMDFMYRRAMVGSVGALALYALLIPYFGVFLSRNFLGAGVLLLTAILPMLLAVIYIEGVKHNKRGAYVAC